MSLVLNDCNSLFTYSQFYIFTINHIESLNVQWMQNCIQSESIFTKCGSNSTGSWRCMRKDTCIATDDCPTSSWSTHCKVLSLLTTDGQCSKEASGCGEVGWTWRLKIWELSGVGEPSGIALIVVAEDLLRSGTVAMEKVSTRESSTASHCPQHTISASILQLRNFLSSSVLTCTQSGGEPFQN